MCPCQVFGYCTLLATGIEILGLCNVCVLKAIMYDNNFKFELTKPFLFFITYDYLTNDNVIYITFITSTLSPYVIKHSPFLSRDRQVGT